MPTTAQLSETGLTAEALLAQKKEGQAPGATEKQKTIGKLQDAIAGDNPREGYRVMKEAGSGINTEEIKLRRSQDFAPRERDATTGELKRTAAQEDRIDRVATAENITSEYLQKGFAALSDPDKDYLRAKVEAQIMQWPEGAKLFNSLPPAERQARIDRMLTTEGAVRHNIREAFNEATKVEALDNKDVLTALKKFEDSQATLKVKELEFNQADAAFTKAFNAADEFTGRRGKAVELGKLQKSKDALMQSLQAAKAEYATLDAQHKLLDSELKSISGYAQNNQQALDEANRVRGEFDTQRQKIAKLGSDIGKAEAQLARLEELEAQKLEAEEKRDALEIERQKAETAFQDAQRNKLDAQASLKMAQDAQEVKENARVAAAEGIVDKGFGNYLDEGVMRGEEARKAMQKAQMEKETDDDKRAARGELLDRWSTDKRSLTNLKGETKMDKKQVAADKDLLMTGGPKEFVKKVLKGKDGGLMSDTRAQELVNDPAFMAEMQNDIIGNFLSVAREANNLSAKDILQLRKTDWGLAGITKSIEMRQTNNPAEVQPFLDHLQVNTVAEAVAKLSGQDKINGTDTSLFLLFLLGKGILELFGSTSKDALRPL